MAGRGRSGLDGATVELADGTVVLRRTTLLADPGEVLGVLGPSGCGKTTILRTIAGLENATEGRVLIDGEPAGPVGERAVSMVFQDSQLVPFLDAARNLAFPLELGGTPRRQARSRAQQEAARFGLDKLLRRKPDALSPGESARVSLGRATMRQPRVFLFDEPFAHLDASARTDMRRELRSVIRQAGVTTFFVTHDVRDAMSICDRVAVVVAGRVLQIGTGREMYDHPVDAVVADLVAPGRLTLLPARTVVSDRMGGYRVADRILPFWDTPPPGLTLTDGQAVLLGIRPEDVHEVPDPSYGTLTGTVRTVESLGPYTAVGIEVGQYTLHARFEGFSSARPGQLITVGLDVAHALVFDAVTGAALKP